MAAGRWVEVVDLMEGDSPFVEPGQSAVVRCEGRFVVGRVFDSSRRRAQPFSSFPHAGQVIRGRDEGVNGMRVGGKRPLTVPPEPACGARGAGMTIRSNAALVFDVELLEIR